MQENGRYWGHSRALKPAPLEQLDLTAGEQRLALSLLRRWNKIKEDAEYKEYWIFGSEEEIKALFDRLGQIISALRNGKRVPDDWFEAPPSVCAPLRSASHMARVNA